MTNYLAFFKDLFTEISSVIDKWQEKDRALHAQGGETIQQIDDLVAQLERLRVGVSEEFNKKEAEYKKKEAAQQYEYNLLSEKKRDSDNKVLAEQQLSHSLQIQKEQEADAMNALQAELQTLHAREESAAEREQIFLPEWLSNELLEQIQSLMTDRQTKFHQLILAFAVYRYASLFEKTESPFWSSVFRNLGQSVHEVGHQEIADTVRAKLNQENEGKFIVQEILPGLPLDGTTMNFPQGQGLQRVKRVVWWPVKRASSGVVLLKADVEAE